MSEVLGWWCSPLEVANMRGNILIIYLCVFDILILINHWHLLIDRDGVKWHNRDMVMWQLLVVVFFFQSCVCIGMMIAVIGWCHGVIVSWYFRSWLMVMDYAVYKIVGS